MKIKILMFLLINLIFISGAQAKLNYQGTEINEVHAKTIKGFLYEVSHSALHEQVSKTWNGRYAKALVWLKNMRNDKKVYNLESYNREEAKIITDTIKVIIKVFNGDFGVNPKYAAVHWSNIGQRVVATTYTKKNKKDIAYKLVLKPVQNRSETKDLLYRY